MRGNGEQQSGMFSYVSPESRVPVKHPLRAILKIFRRGLERRGHGIQPALLEYRKAIDRTAKTDPDASLARKGSGKEALLSYYGNLLTENRSGIVADVRAIDVTPHVAQNTGRPGGSETDARTTRHGGYRVSQRKRRWASRKWLPRTYRCYPRSWA